MSRTGRDHYLVYKDKLITTAFVSGTAKPVAFSTPHSKYSVLTFRCDEDREHHVFIKEQHLAQCIEIMNSSKQK
jgi:hypothetical protein